MKDSESRPTNLLFHDGKLYFVDGFTTGMLTSIDLEGNRSPVQQAIFAKYWGDFVGGRSFVKDMLTGTVYAIRDLRTEYYDGPGMSLCCAPSVWALPAPRRSADRHRTGSQQPVPGNKRCAVGCSRFGLGLSRGQIDRERFGRSGGHTGPPLWTTMA